MMTLLLVTSLSEMPPNTIGNRYFWWFAFIGIVHLAYAVGGRERGWGLHPQRVDMAGWGGAKCGKQRE